MKDSLPTEAEWEYAALMVAPAIDRAYVVVTNSCDFGVTDVLCVEMTNKIAKMDQNL